MIQVQQLAQEETQGTPGWLSPSLAEYFSKPGGAIFLGTLSADLQTAVFNILFILLLGLVIWLSMAWSFTEEWGEYFALLIWATVGMMLLAASEELVTLFLTLETMTICLYLSTAFEKTRRRSAEGGLKYFVYGSVSSALFLFGLSLLYGLTGTTQFEGDPRSAGVPRARRPVGSRVTSPGRRPSCSCWWASGSRLPRCRSTSGRPTPTKEPRAGDGLDRHRLEARQLHRPHEGVPPRAAALVAPLERAHGPGLAGRDRGRLGRDDDLRQLRRAGPAELQADARLLVDRPRRLHAGRRGRGQRLHPRAEAAGSVLYYLVVYAFANVGAFAVAAWLVRDKKTDDIDDLNGLGMQSPLLAICILVLMLSLIGIPPFAGFFGKLYMFMEALNQQHAETRLTLIGLVALGLFNSVVSAFYYVRVLKAMFLREPGGARRLGLAGRSIEIPIAIGTLVAIVFGLFPGPLISVMQAASVPMLTATAGGFASMVSAPSGTGYAPPPPDKGPAPPSPKSPGLDPETAKKYGTRMKKAQASASPGGQAKKAPPGQAKNALAKKAGSSTEGSVSFSGSIPPRIHPAARFGVKRETRRPWRSSTRSRSAWRVPTWSRTRRHRRGSASCWPRPATGSKPP